MGNYSLDLLINSSANNTSLQVNVTGLKIVKTVTGPQNVRYTCLVDESSRTAQLVFYGSGFSIASGQSNYEVISFIPSQYRPSHNLFSSIGRTQHLLFYLWSNGTVGLSNFHTSTLSNQSASCLLQWEY